MAEVEASSSSRAMQVIRGKEVRGNDLLNSNLSNGATRTYVRRRPPYEGLHGENVSDGTSVCDPPPDMELVLSSNSCWSGAEPLFDPAAFEASLSVQAPGDPKVPSFRLGVQGGELSSALLISEVNLSQDSSHNQGVRVKRKEGTVTEWPLATLGNRSRGEVAIEPLAVDYSFFQKPNKALTVE